MGAERTFEDTLAELLHENPQLVRAALTGLIGSAEFAAARAAWRLPDAATPAIPGAPLNDEAFVRLAYRWLLAREADPGGLAHYTRALSAGETRTGVLRALVLSDEFERRFRSLPVNTQLCELANPAKWDNAEWLAILRDLQLSTDKLSMHRKPYEFAQLVYGCRRLGALTSEASVLSVGAGHELILYWLANHVRLVVASDMYGGVWQNVQGREGDPRVLKRPEDYAPFPYRADHLAFVRMDGRSSAFRNDSFDIVYSLSSIEHFGGFEGAGQTVREMARVLKPGGVLALATEYVLSGPPHDETFQPEEIARLLKQPSLTLVEPIDDGVYRRCSFDPVDLYQTPFRTPHMVVRFGSTVFTTVMVFLRKA
jgi:SAM-dependent methyltransferase